MVIKSFIGINDLFFTDNFREISNKLKRFKIEKGERMFMDEVNLTLFVDELNLSVIFNNKSGDSVEYFEIDRKDVFFEDMNLMKLKYEFLKKLIEKTDPNIKVIEEGFDSPKYGFGIYRGLKNGKYTIYPKSVIVFNKDYLSKDLASEENLLKFYLGEDYNPDTEVNKWT
jgi:hypothetical protein